MKKSFRLSSDSRNQSRIVKLRLAHGAAGYGVYIMLLERLCAADSHSMALDYDVLAFDFHVEPQLVRSVVEDFDLFEFTAEVDAFFSEVIMSQCPARKRRDVALRNVPAGGEAAKPQNPDFTNSKSRAEFFCADALVGKADCSARARAPEASLSLMMK